MLRRLAYICGQCTKLYDYVTEVIEIGISSEAKGDFLYNARRRKGLVAAHFTAKRLLTMKQKPHTGALYGVKCEV